LVLINLDEKISTKDRKKLGDWLKVRLEPLHSKDSLSLILN